MKRIGHRKDRVCTQAIPECYQQGCWHSKPHEWHEYCGNPCRPGKRIWATKDIGERGTPFSIYGGDQEERRRMKPRHCTYRREEDAIHNTRTTQDN